MKPTPSKTVAIVESTKNYNQFVSHDNNRGIILRHVEALMGSLQSFGWWPSRPIQCYRRADGKLVVIDGHHRLRAAEALEIAVLYVVEQEANKVCIGIGNSLIRKWTGIDFVKLFAEQGNQHYATLLQYVQRGLLLHNAASLLYGQSAHSGNAVKSIATGGFLVKTTKQADAILEAFDTLGGSIPIIKSKVFTEALSCCLAVSSFEIRTFISRALANPRGFDKCVNREQAIRNIDEVYNFRAREKLDLCAEVKKAMDERNKCKAATK